MIEKLENEVTERQKEDAKASSSLTSKKDTLKAEQKKLIQINKQFTNVSYRVYSIFQLCPATYCSVPGCTENS